MKTRTTKTVALHNVASLPRKLKLMSSVEGGSLLHKVHAAIKELHPQMKATMRILTAATMETRVTVRYHPHIFAAAAIIGLELMRV